MFALGLLSVLQMVCFPGLLISALLKIHNRGIARLVLIFGTSLLANYLLVFLLTITHLYSRPALIIIMILELAALVWIYRKQVFTPLEPLFERFTRWLNSLRTLSFKPTRPSHFLKVVEYCAFAALLVLALVDIAWVAARFTNNLGTVFNTWDAIVSWNHWAVSWSQGIIPETSYYPQLLPTNWSLSYVLLGGNELQFFPKAIMPLFSLFMLLMLLDLGIQTRSLGYFIAILFTRLVIKKFTGEFISDGYADLPTAFFGLASVYMLIKYRLAAGESKANRNWLIASGLLATAAAFTKQPGVLILVLFPLLVSFLAFRSLAGPSTREKWKPVLWCFGAALLLVGSWYAYKWMNIRLGHEFTNIGYVTNEIYHGAGYLERAKNAYLLLGKYGPLLIAVLPAVFFIKTPEKWLGVFLVIPYSIIWMFLFSYEARNLALVFPLWGMMLGLALQQIFEYGIRLCALLRLQKIPLVTLPIIATAAILCGIFLFPSQKLLDLQTERQWQILSPELNTQIRDLVSQTGTDIKVLTNYPIDYLPGLKGSQVSYWYDNLADFQAALKNPEIDYLLVPPNINSEIDHIIQTGLQNNTMELLFTSEGGYAYQMIRVLH